MFTKFHRGALLLALVFVTTLGASCTALQHCLDQFSLGVIFTSFQRRIFEDKWHRLFMSRMPLHLI